MTGKTWCCGFRRRIARWTRDGGKRALRTGFSEAGRSLHTSPDLFDPRGQLLHEVVHRAVLADQARDLGGRVDDRRVVAAAELLADLRERRIGELAREVHRDLAGIDDVLRASVAGELFEREAEALRDEFLDPLDRDLGGLALREDVAQDVLCEGDGHRAAGQRREGDDARERTLEVADGRR